MYVRVCVCLRFAFMLVFDSTYMANKDIIIVIRHAWLKWRYGDIRCKGAINKGRRRELCRTYTRQRQNSRRHGDPLIRIISRIIPRSGLQLGLLIIYLVAKPCPKQLSNTDPRLADVLNLTKLQLVVFRPTLILQYSVWVVYVNTVSAKGSSMRQIGRSLAMFCRLWRRHWRQHYDWSSKWFLSVDAVGR